MVIAATKVKHNQIMVFCTTKRLKKQILTFLKFHNDFMNIFKKES
jgi:hypothetical protein